MLLLNTRTSKLRNKQNSTENTCTTRNLINYKYYEQIYDMKTNIQKGINLKSKGYLHILKFETIISITHSIEIRFNWKCSLRFTCDVTDGIQICMLFRKTNCVHFVTQFYIARQLKNCNVVFQIIHRKSTVFKEFNDVKRLLDRSSST